MEEAAHTAQAADEAVIFAGLPDRFESEGFDQESMAIPAGHLRMIEVVSRADPNTVVVPLCGCALECPWADEVKGILYMGVLEMANGFFLRGIVLMIRG